MRRLLLPLLLSLAAAGCSSEPSGPPPGGTLTTFERIDTVAGTGTEAVPGSKVTVHYKMYAVPIEDKSVAKKTDTKKKK